jgi:hypothetical protein
MAQGTMVERYVEEPSCYMGSALAAGWSVAAPSLFPYGLDNAAMIHSWSMRPAMSARVGLPEYRLLATFELSGCTIETSSTDSSEDSDGWTGVDFSGLRDLEVLCV